MHGRTAPCMERLTKKTAGFLRALCVGSEVSVIRIPGINARTLARVLALALFVPVATAHASTFKVLYSFMSAGDGGNPCCSSLVLDNSSNLYGTTALPGGYGAVFKLTHVGTETVLYFPRGHRRLGTIDSAHGRQEQFVGNHRGRRTWRRRHLQDQFKGQGKTDSYIRGVTQ